MKRYRFGNKNLDVKSETLKHIISATLSCGDITREAVSRHASVSLSTAGKVLSALDECRFTELKYVRDNRVGPPSKSHAFSLDLSVMVLDFSSSLYTAYIVFGKAQRVILEEYRYNPSISFEDNVVVFLSNVALKNSKLDYSVSAICSVIADDPQRISYATDVDAAYIPRRSDMSTVNGYCARFFKIVPPLCLTKSEALTCAVRYNIFDLPVGSDVSYVGISESVNAYHLPHSSHAIPCNIDRLMIDNSTILSAFTQKATTSGDMAYLITRCLNFMSCAYDTDAFLVEIDRAKFPDIEKRVELFFKSAELSVPRIHYIDSEPPSAILGASFELFSALIASHIRGN